MFNFYQQFIYPPPFQVDSQIAGASLPVLMFRSPPLAPSASAQTLPPPPPPTSSSKSSSRSTLLHGRPIQGSALGGEWIAGRELERLLQPHAGKAQGGQSAPPPTPPTLITRSLRMLHTGWKAELFTLLEVILSWPTYNGKKTRSAHSLVCVSEVSLNGAVKLYEG